jgi:ABC-type transporter Mla MlaB component
MRPHLARRLRYMIVASNNALLIMVRITVSKRQKESVVAISGQLAASELDELKRVRRSVSGTVILDLEGLESADAESLAELRDWIQDGAQTQGASPYIQMLLEQTSGTGKSEGKHE